MSMILNPYRYAGASATSLLLDQYSGAEVAFSVRHVRTAYSGPAMKVVRASDSVEANVAFAGGVVNLDSAVTITSGSSSATTLGELVAAGGYSDADALGSVDTATVKTWYDQSGNSFDVTNTTISQQPTLVSAGTLITEAGISALDFDGGDSLTNAGSPSYSAGLFMMAVLHLDLESSSIYRIASDDITGVQGSFIWYPLRFDVNDGAGYARNSISSNLDHSIRSISFSESDGSWVSRLDGTETTGTASGWSGSITPQGAANFGLMASGNNAQFGNGRMQEFIAWGFPYNGTDHDSIQAEVNGFYLVF